jgi:hypothetical protein
MSRSKFWLSWAVVLVIFAISVSYYFFISRPTIVHITSLVPRGDGIVYFPDIAPGVDSNTYDDASFTLSYEKNVSKALKVPYTLSLCRQNNWECINQWSWYITIFGNSYQKFSIFSNSSLERYLTSPESGFVDHGQLDLVLSLLPSEDFQFSSWSVLSGKLILDNLYNYKNNFGQEEIYDFVEQYDANSFSNNLITSLPTCSTSYKEDISILSIEWHLDNCYIQEYTWWIPDGVGGMDIVALIHNDQLLWWEWWWAWCSTAIGCTIHDWYACGDDWISTHFSFLSGAVDYFDVINVSSFGKKFEAWLNDDNQILIEHPYRDNYGNIYIPWYRNNYAFFKNRPTTDKMYWLINSTLYNTSGRLPVPIKDGIIKFGRIYDIVKWSFDETLIRTYTSFKIETCEYKP